MALFGSATRATLNLAIALLGLYYLLVTPEGLGRRVRRLLPVSDAVFERLRARFVAVTEAMLGWLAEYHIGLVRKVGRERQTVAEHQRILDRIVARDVDGAAAAMHAHLTRAHDLYVSAETKEH